MDTDRRETGQPFAGLSYKTCSEQIPADESLQAEVEEMVFFLCGAECYEQWRKPKESAE